MYGISPDETFTEVNGGISIIQKKDSLIYGTDALLLAAFLRKKARARAVEFGAGCGVVSLLAAKSGKVGRVYAYEINPQNCECMEKNIEINGLADKVIPVCSDIRDIKLEDIGGEADAVFMNPPYMTVDSGKRNEGDGKYVARHEVFGNIGDFCAAASKILKHGGSLYAVYRPDRLADLICSMRDNHLEPKRMIMVYDDAEHDASIVLLEAKKYGKPSVFVPKPFFIKDRDGYTKDMMRIYENGEFDERYLCF